MLEARARLRSLQHLAAQRTAAAEAAQGDARARSHCRFVPPLIHCIPDLLTYSVPLFLKRQCDRTQGAAASKKDADLAAAARRVAEQVKKALDCLYL
jgi:hypothetical protein